MKPAKDREHVSHMVNILVLQSLLKRREECLLLFVEIHRLCPSMYGLPKFVAWFFLCPHRIKCFDLFGREPERLKQRRIFSEIQEGVIVWDELDRGPIGLGGEWTPCNDNTFKQIVSTRVDERRKEDVV